MNPQHLADAVSCWLTFEALCKRTNLFSERYLAHAIGQYLNATSSQPVTPEVNHPVLHAAGTRGRPPQIDFVIHPRNSTTIMHAVETKWINDSRSFTKEVLEDLLRLELLRAIDQRGGRWFLCAGKYRHICQKLFEVTGYANGASHVIFANILERNLDEDAKNVELENSVDPFRRHWKEAASLCGGTVPRRFHVRLEGKAPTAPDIEEDAWACFVWKVSRSRHRAECTL